MIEMNTEAVIVPAIRESFHYVTMNECCRCYSLQPCVSDATTYRCADWHACQKRQGENSQPDSPKLTPADYAGLLARMETQQGDMERLRRIEAAALAYSQAHDALQGERIDRLTMELVNNVELAARALVAVVKGGKK